MLPPVLNELVLLFDLVLELELELNFTDGLDVELFDELE